MGQTVGRDLKMNYSEFCKAFYGRPDCGLRGTKSQTGIAAFFIELGLVENDDDTFTYDESLYRKWFAGTRVPSPEIWSTIYDRFDPATLTERLYTRLNDNFLPVLASRFELNAGPHEPDKYILASAIVRQLHELAIGEGIADLIIPKAYIELAAPAEFPDYITGSLEHYSRIKTLLYASESRPFNEFYVCNNISVDKNNKSAGGHEENVIGNATLDKLLQISRCVMIVGIGGMGKSMMMRHLFLESMSRFSKTGIMPVFVTLREFGEITSDIFSLIVDSVQRYDNSFTETHLHNLLKVCKICAV